MISRALQKVKSFHAILLVFVAFAFVMLPVKNGYILRWYDEMSLFMTGDIFLSTMLHYPGGLLQYAGTWLTQLMYYPWLGSSVLIALWVILTLICDCVWRLREGLRGLTLLPAMFLLASILVLDEAWVSINYNGYLFAPTLGAICAVSIAGISLQIKSFVWRSIFLTACTALFMPLGFYALLGTVTGIAGTFCAKSDSDVTHRKEKKPYIVLIALIATALVPHLYYNLYSGMTGDSNHIYLEGLPVLLMKRHDLYLWIPLASMALTIIALPLLSLTRKKATDESREPGYHVWLAFSILLATGCYSVIAGYKSEQFRATVLMIQHIDTMRWDKINYVMSHIKEPPTFTMKVIGNLAAIKLGGGNKSVKQTPTEDESRPRHKESFLMTAFVNVPVYYHIGNTHGSYRWAMEHTVKYGKRTFYIKYMVRNSIIHGEYELAAKYNRLLLNTMFHRKWAEHFQRYIDNPELIKESREFNSIPENPATNLFV